MENNHEISPKSLGNRQPKGSNFDPQLQFPWFNPSLQENLQVDNENPSRVSVLCESHKLDPADQKMQKITQLRDKKVEPLPHPEFSFEDSVRTLPPVIEPPVDLMADNESEPIRELPENFIGKGEVKDFKFTQLKKSNLAYLYQVQNTGPAYYEIFERRVNTQFGNVSYPGSEAFGRWATTTDDFQKALEIFDALNHRRIEPCV